MPRSRFSLTALVLPALLFGLALLPACGGKDSGSGTSESSKSAPSRSPASDAAPTKPSAVIGVSLLTRTHPFYQDLEAGLQAAAAEHNYELLVQSGEFDVARQKDQLENFLVRKVDAIVVCPCDSRSIGTTVQAANAAGIPVFTADIAVLADQAKVICHTASDNVAGGRLAAQALAEAVGQSGEIAIIDHPEVESVIQRVAGFEEELARHPGVTIVAKLPGRGTKDIAFRTAEDILQAHPGLDGFFGINDDTALGALAAVEKAGKLGQVAIVGFDAVPEARAAWTPRSLGRRSWSTTPWVLRGPRRSSSRSSSA